jgi:hypothetical protein
MTIFVGRSEYNVPVTVAVTTALAAGGVLIGGDVPPPSAVPIDLPVDKTPQTVAIGGTLTITWPAMGASEFGMVTAIGITTTDAVNTRVTTRVDGVSVPPYQASIGAIGTMDNPTQLPVPIRLGPGQVFSFFMENINAGATVDMNARTQGWRSNT